MSHLPYTGGQNGNGITDIDELIAYIHLCPTAMWDDAFMSSYDELIERNYRKRRVREFFDPCSDSD
jgi:hypothetical protein